MDEETLRLFLHNLLELSFGQDMQEIYYNPSGDIPLSRPCIVYKLDRRVAKFANNKPYVKGLEYQVIFLSNLPGYMESHKVYDIPGITARHNEQFTSDDIVHDIFTVSVNVI